MIMAGAAALPLVAQAAPALARSPATRLVKLSDNENPYGPSRKAMAALVQAAQRDASRYPEPYVDALAEVLAAEERVPVASLFFGGGSAEILHATGAAFGIGGGAVVAPQPTFGMMLSYVRTVGGSVINVPVRPDFQIDLPAMEAAITPATRLVYLCNPNNPTGAMLEPDALRAFCRRVSARVPVFVDECYVELADDPARNTMVDLVREGLPVIVSRTFSKLHGMAGLRVGYGIAPPELAKRIDRYRMSLLNVPGLAAARASLLDTRFRSFSKDMITQGRSVITGVLDELGLPHVPSTANFVMFEAKRPATELVKALEARGVEIAARWPTVPGHARVSTGRIEDLQRFAQAMRGVYRG
jgi:histidinol-phosphate aminotransferase